MLLAIHVIFHLDTLHVTAICPGEGNHVSWAAKAIRYLTWIRLVWKFEGPEALCASGHQCK